MRNGNGRPSRREVEERIHELRATGIAQAAIAAKLGISVRMVRHVIDPEAAETESRRARDKTATRRAAKEAAREDIAAQVTYDRNRPSPRGVWRARVEAVLEAERALQSGMLGAWPALRQAYVDVAAASEVIAESIDLADDPFPEAAEHDPEPAIAA